MDQGNEQLQPQDEKKDALSGSDSLEHSEQTLHQKLEELQQSLDLAHNSILREKAENDNLRKRAFKDLEDCRKYAINTFALDLTEVLENLYRALENLPSELGDSNENVSSFITGIVMTQKILLSTFEKHGISRIHPMGELFDHNLHQAVAKIVDETRDQNTVVQVISSGYKIKERLLKPAIVALSVKPEPSPQEQALPQETLS